MVWCDGDWPALPGQGPQHGLDGRLKRFDGDRFGLDADDFAKLKCFAFKAYRVTELYGFRKTGDAAEGGRDFRDDTAFAQGRLLCDAG